MYEQEDLSVLIAVDGSEHSSAALSLVAGIPWPAGSSMHILAVVLERWLLSELGSEGQSALAETLEAIRLEDRDEAKRLAEHHSDLLKAQGLIVEAEVREGRPSEVILERAGTLDADLLVIGAKGLSAPEEFRLGSTAHKLAHYAECSVLVARPSERKQPIHILLTADGSMEAQRAAEFLQALPLPDWAEVTVVSVVEVKAQLTTADSRSTELHPAVRRLLLGAAEAHASDLVRCLDGCRAQVRTTILIGNPSEKILSVAREQDADLIVIGARGQTRSELFRLGGVAQKVVKYAHCSVLVVR
jgi:nucleotide-binding universal stress UspA family protein